MLYSTMVASERILQDNFAEYFTLGCYALEQKQFNSATTLFFKAIAAAIDLYLLKYEGKIPSSHSNRFRILQHKYPLLYTIADRDFPFYQDSYTQRMDSETAVLLKEDAQTIKKMLGI